LHAALIQRREHPDGSLHRWERPNGTSGPKRKTTSRSTEHRECQP
jgi:hypothetical protein